jgi:hypothetical protein
MIILLIFSIKERKVEPYSGFSVYLKQTYFMGIAERYIHQDFALPAGVEERFHGYGIMGLTFDTGHILALRHFPSSSIGKGYSSVWHRRPDRSWDFYADVAPEIACTRYFSHAADNTYIDTIKIEWKNENRVSVEIKRVNLFWESEFTSNWKTSLLNYFIPGIPISWWKNERFLNYLGMAAGKFLNAGKIGLHGIVPNQQRFIANPYRLWIIKKSFAVIDGENLGNINPLEKQEKLADFWIPQKGILAIGRTYFDPYDPHQHLLPGRKK